MIQFMPTYDDSGFPLFFNSEWIEVLSTPNPAQFTAVYGPDGYILFVDDYNIWQSDVVPPAPSTPVHLRDTSHYYDADVVGYSYPRFVDYFEEYTKADIKSIWINMGSNETSGNNFKLYPAGSLWRVSDESSLLYGHVILFAQPIASTIDWGQLKKKRNSPYLQAVDKTMVYTSVRVVLTKEEFDSISNEDLDTQKKRAQPRRVRVPLITG